MSKPSGISERLYHYTNWDGLLGILKDRTLWATHYKFLNDDKEIVLFRDKLVSFLVPHVRDEYEKMIKDSPDDEKRINAMGGMSRAVQHDTELRVDKMYNATGPGIYILSFYGQHEKKHVNINGLLSQWRGYGAGGGFALVFNTQKLKDILEIEGKRFNYKTRHFGKVIYSDESDEEEIFKQELSPELSIIAKAVRMFFHQEELSEEEILKETEKAFEPFVQCISRYKHRGFSEENEVRVVLLPTVVNEEYLKLAKEENSILSPEKEIKFRTKNSERIPYIELFKSIGIDLPIERIIVGPHKEQNGRAAALREMLRNTKIEVRCSDIPYIS